jgi:electron-transferring-flavoprotein dehydrogenase
MSDVTAIERESMEFDVLVVGGGPAGLAAAIRLRQLALAQGQECSVCVIEKGAEIGAHTLSGAVMDPLALGELIPDWQARGAPLEQPVTADRFLFLTESKAWQTPDWLLPDCFRNHGNFVISLGNVVRWLAEQAESLGVDIYPGFAAASVLYDEQGAVCGVLTGDLGIGRDGQAHSGFQPGMELRARYVLFAEGARGHLGRQLIERFKLNQGRDPQVYGIGLKELWEIDPARHQPGLVIHTAGWPLPADTYGGSFLYHMAHNQVAVGYVVGLGYRNPWLSPFEEFQRYKTHPAIRSTFEGGRRLAYGARAITAGGLQALPELIFPGGALIGCEAGFLNVSRIKGSHAAIKSGMLAGEAAFAAVAADRRQDLLQTYPDAFRASWLHAELHRARNFKPAMSKGLWLGALLVGIDQKLLGGKAPWTLHHEHADHEALQAAAECARITYPKPDGVISFDRLSSVFLSNTNHEENQPIHLTLKRAEVAVDLNLARFAGPEARYCPAGVYEYVDSAGNSIDQPSTGARLQINAQNCVHCKTCDIKDPSQNIVWITPEGGGGPTYIGGM